MIPDGVRAAASLPQVQRILRSVREQKEVE